MMKCREYIFLISSGKIDDASVGVRLDAGMHRLICKYCRSFSRNNKQLDKMLDAYREELKKPERE
ncbi:MAG: hypothetical protein H7A09_06110 [Oceanospirillaceae bacterium]|nr:hypothetical protein [Oceanospirillaceae bacterium]MCP5334640.1 hypothetical protein [Oceanospirillaceae bacterium]MCP5351354.1 hypothetical protein [Oceanospirillaceae bacterium]